MMRRITPGADGSHDRRLMIASGLAGAAMAGGACAAEAAFPARPLFILAPTNPGGGVDQIARLMRVVLAEEKLSPRPVEVINRGGAGGAIGLAEVVSRHHGDPYLVMSGGGATVSATIAQKSPFRMTDVDPLARLTVDDIILAVPSDSKFRNIDEFLEAFRRDPGSITWCGGGAGGIDHITVALIAEACGHRVGNIRYVAYPGGGAAIGALLGGQVNAGVSGYSEWSHLAAEGRIRILASASAERFGDKQIPTLRQAGLDVVMMNWRGLFAPRGIKPEHYEWWRSTIERMHASPTWQDFLKKNDWRDGYLDGASFREIIKQDEARFTELIPRLGLGGATGGASPVGPYVFPALIAAGAVVAGGALVAEQVHGKGGPVAPAGAEDDDEGGGPTPTWKRVAAGTGLTLAYIGALALVGFLVATPVFVLGLSYLMRSKRPVRDFIVGGGMTLAVWLLFTRLLFVDLP